MFTVIDVFSKFVWIIPLKRKTRQEVENAFSRIPNERIAGKMWVDKGREFYNKDVKSYLSSILQKAKKNLALLKDLMEEKKTKFFNILLQIQLGNT